MAARDLERRGLDRRASSDAERLVRRAWVAFIGAGIDGMLDHCTRDVTWRSFLADGRLATGPDQIRKMLARLQAEGVSMVTVPYRYSVVGSSVIVAVDSHVTNRGASDLFQAYLVYQVRDGKIASLCEFTTAQEAVDAAGAYSSSGENAAMSS